MVLTALLMLPVIYYLALLLLPAHFRLEGVRLDEDGTQAEIHGTPFKVRSWLEMVTHEGSTKALMLILILNEYFNSTFN